MGAYEDMTPGKVALIASLYEKQYTDITDEFSSDRELDEFFERAMSFLSAADEIIWRQRWEEA